MHFFLYYLWVAPHLLLVLCLLGIVRRKGQYELPLFTSGQIFALIQFSILFIIAQRRPYPRDVYQWTLTVTNAIGTVWELAIVYELANKVLFARAPVARFARPILRATLAILVLLSAVGSGAFSDLSSRRVLNILERLDFSSQLIMAGMLVAVLLLTRTFHISWGNWATGIMLGYGVYASIALVGAALRAAFGQKALIPVDVVQMTGFHACVVIWLVYIFLPRSENGPPGNLRKSDLDRWDHAVQEMIPAHPDSGEGHHRAFASENHTRR